MSAAGGILSAYGQVKAGEGAQRAYEFNANQADQNARQAELIAAQEERQTRIIGKKAIGSMVAAYGASGVSLEGSPMDVLAESLAQTELDALNVRYSGQSKAINLRNEARINRYQGSQAKASGYYGAAATLMSSYANAAKEAAAAGSGGK
jgi:hypothetical protein